MEETSKKLSQEYVIVGADLSLKRPGFSILHMKNENIEKVQFFAINNKTKKKPRGQLLLEIYEAFDNMLKALNGKDCIFVRQKSINNMNTKFARSGSMAIGGISQVVGIMDYLVWKERQTEWEEFYPVSIKKMLTNNGKADKNQVANSLIEYVGQQTYKYDDESDAVAVAIAWLISKKIIKPKYETQEKKDNEE